MYICVLKLSVSPNFWKRIGWMGIPTNPSFPQRQLGSIRRDFPFRKFSSEWLPLMQTLWPTRSPDSSRMGRNSGRSLDLLAQSIENARECIQNRSQYQGGEVGQVLVQCSVKQFLFFFSLFCSVLSPNPSMSCLFLPYHSHFFTISPPHVLCCPPGPDY